VVATIFSILKCMFYSIVTYQEYFDGVGPSPKKGGGAARPPLNPPLLLAPQGNYRVGQKRGHRLMTIILSIVNRFKNFFTERFLRIFAVKLISKIPPHVVYVATLPCKTLMSAKQAINDKLQGSVVIYLRCGGVVNK